MTVVASFDIGSKNFAFTIEKFDSVKLGCIKPPTVRYNKNFTATDEFKHTLNEVYKNGEILQHMNIDLTKGIPQSKLKSYLNPGIFRNMISELDRYKLFFEEVDIVIIEQQMSFGTKLNIKAVKIGQACFTYFLMRYPNVEVLEFGAFHKTKVLGAIKGLTKPQRKKFAVEETKNILSLREDFENLGNLSIAKKKDDLADTIVQLQAFKILRFIDLKL